MNDHNAMGALPLWVSSPAMLKDDRLFPLPGGNGNNEKLICRI